MTTIPTLRRACGVCIVLIFPLVALSPGQNHDAKGNDHYYSFATATVAVKLSQRSGAAIVVVCAWALRSPGSKKGDPGGIALFSSAIRAIYEVVRK